MMTNKDAIAELKDDIDLYIPTNGTIEDVDRELPDGRLITALEMAIEALETQTTGMWIKSESHTQYFYCSCCKPKGSGDDKWREIFDCRYKYCPNCGARMENGI